MKILINFLTIGRILSGPFIFIFINYLDAFTFALFLFFIASISDFFDGYLARKYMATSQLGEILDPIADKILICFSIFGLAIHFGSNYIGLIGSFILAREFWIAALRDYNSRNNNISATKVTFLAKLKTTIQIAAIGSYLLGLAFGNAMIIFIAHFILLLAFVITIQTGFQYSLNTFKSNPK
jgi:CDP-diacylglycerol--glycerol-3-phosphate 3-phosphatidyltransferase